ncbi:Kelch 21 [Fusarium agapanthi]|uniref:Kelch 21 n=1 Tax=Fusarium agapanthi TaxID=1803897 RepID=A0A9P5EC39_9HYPO|nr:Kelch 21 [Fusarium agapanthi]
MDLEDTRARIVQARESGEFTDFTFACNGRNIKVHKIIICSQSPVFRAACAGQFKEAFSGIYDLTSHQPDMVQLMVDYLYMGDYSIDMSEADETNTASNSGALSTHAIMYALGDEYDIKGLRDLSARKYSWSLDESLELNEFLSSIPFVYTLTPDSSRGLRDPALEFARNKLRHVGGQSDNRDAFDELLIECPDFLKELLYYCVQAPSLGYCPCTGPRDRVPVEAEGYRCKACGKEGTSLNRPV